MNLKYLENFKKVLEIQFRVGIYVKTLWFFKVFICK